MSEFLKLLLSLSISGTLLFLLTEDYHGGWSLYNGKQTENTSKFENDETNKAAYMLFCLKQIVFEDGTVWNNPDYEDWYKVYAGKETSIDKLQNYYPYQYELE